MSLTLDRLAAGLALAGFAHFTHAAGFALAEQNASGLGNAYAGQAASAQDASTIFFNPAGMTLLPDSQLVLAGSLIYPQAEFTGTAFIGGNPSNLMSGGNGGDAGDLAFLPNAYFAYRVSPDIVVGVGMGAPFGLKTEYDSTWKGRTQAIKSELKTININPSIAWKASDSLSLGAGISFQYAEATLTNASPAGLVTVEGDDTGWGFNLGALWQLSEATRIGFAYRSEVDQTLEGDVTFSVVSALNGPVSAGITLPDSASLSAFHKLDARWELLADITWTGWSDFDELRIVRDSGATLGTPTTENWDDSYRYSVGANYRLDDKLMLRGGVAYDETPVPDAYRTARIPDENRTWLAFGVQYRLSAASMIDVGYAHLFIDDPRINKTESGITLSGDYDNSVDILSAQLTMDF